MRTSSPPATRSGSSAVERRLVVVEEVERWKAADAKAVAAVPRAARADDRARARRRRGQERLRAGEGVSRRPARCSSSTCRRAAGAARRTCRSGSSSSSATAASRSTARPPGLVELVGEDAQELATEVDKLATWAGGELIGEREVVELVAAGPRRRRSTSPTRGGGATSPRVLAASERLVERSGDASRDVLLRTRRPAGEPRRPRARMPGARRPRASRPPRGAERLKRQPFYVQKLYEQARNYTPDELAQRRRPARRARPRAEGRQQASGRARARARAGRRSPDRPSRQRAPRARNRSRRRAGRPAPSCARRCSGGARRGRRPCRPSGRARGAPSAIRSLSPASTAARKPARQRLHRRAVAEVLEPLLSRGPDALLLLLDVRHSVKKPATRAAAMVAAGSN